MRKFRSLQLGWLMILTTGLVLLTFGAAGAVGSTGQVHGRIENGVRVIQASPDQLPSTISVYRGDTVQLILTGSNRPYSVRIPAYKIDVKSEGPQGVRVKFKAKTLGQFPVYVRFNNQGPEWSAMIAVRQYESAPTAIYREFTAQQARNFIAQNSPLILDVRTDGEYREGHLAQSKLIPVQELARRLSELEAYKNRDIFIYCRSGNRSTVAAAIMEKSGFRRLYNLRHGIIDWARQGYPIVK